jgi:hypothetical protein
VLDQPVDHESGRDVDAVLAGIPAVPLYLAVEVGDREGLGKFHPAIALDPPDDVVRRGIERAEESDQAISVRTLRRLAMTYETAGVEFIGENKTIAPVPVSVGCWIASSAHWNTQGEPMGAARRAHVVIRDLCYS